MSVRVLHKKLFNLEPETNYIAYVSAVTSAGAGPSLSVVATTTLYARLYSTVSVIALWQTDGIERDKGLMGNVSEKSPHATIF